MYTIVVDKFGAVLGKRGLRLVVKAPIKEKADPNIKQLELPFMATISERNKSVRPRAGVGGKTKYEIISEMPFDRVSDIILGAQGISLSTDVIRECCERGIVVHFMDFSGESYGIVTSPSMNALIKTRREQLYAYNDRRGVQIAKAILLGKARNQINIVRYFGKYIKQLSGSVFNQLEKSISEMEALHQLLAKSTAQTIESCRVDLMNIEARISSVYWKCVQMIISDKVEFSGRQHRGAADPVNAMLNYSYGILRGKVWASIVFAGLDPFAGFLHADRSGRPSLVFDLIEEFRQPVCDRAVIAMINTGFTPDIDREGIDFKSRRSIAEKVYERLESKEQYCGRKLEILSIIQAQARQLAVCLREGRDYEPFHFKW